MYVTWGIERYERTGDSVWSSTAIDITKFYDPIIRMSLGEGKDTFSFKQTNFAKGLDDYWNIGDKIVIKYKVNSSTLASSDVLMTGIVTNIPNEDSTGNNLIRIEGNNYSETLMNALVFYAPDGATPLVTYLKEALNSISLYNENFKVSWSSGNPLVKTDSTAFPSYTERWYYKSFLKLIEQYSSNSYTEDGNYYWYVNKDNELVWKPKVSTISDTFNSSSDDYQSLKTKKDIKGVVNFVINKGGLSPAMKPITIKYDNATSRAKHGFKYKLILSKRNTADSLMQEDGVLDEGNSSRYPSSYPFSTVWKRDDTGVVVTCNSDSDYDGAIRDEVKRRLKKEAKEYVSVHKDGKLQLELSFSNGKGWSIGDVIQVTVASIGFSAKPLRVKDAEYTSSGERYVLEEDEGTI